MAKLEEYYRIPRRGVKIAGVSIIGLAAVVTSVIVCLNICRTDRIAFMSDRDGSDEIYVMDADGSNQRRLTYNLPFEYNPPFKHNPPVWSPDGSRIACYYYTSAAETGSCQEHGSIVFDSDGGNRRIFSFGEVYY